MKCVKKLKESVVGKRVFNKTYEEELQYQKSKEIAEKEEIMVNPKALELIAKKSNGDMRSAINTLQALSDKEDYLEIVKL